MPSREQLVIITKNNYQQQTVQVTLGPQPDHLFWENPPPTLAPNPVHDVLHPVKPVGHVGSVSRTHTAKTQEPATSAVAPPPFGGGGGNGLQAALGAGPASKQ